MPFYVTYHSQSFLLHRLRVSIVYTFPVLHYLLFHCSSTYLRQVCFISIQSFLPHRLRFYLLTTPCGLVVPPILRRSKHLTISFVLSVTGPQMLGSFIFAFTPLSCTLCCTAISLFFPLCLFSHTSSYHLSFLSCLIKKKKKKKNSSYSHYLYSKFVLNQCMFLFGHPSSSLPPGFCPPTIFHFWLGQFDWSNLK